MVLQSSANNLYHLLVVDNTLTVEIRNPGGIVDKVPALNDGDIVIAVLKYTGSDPMQVQYLTNWKTSNSLSLAHNGGGTTYTETGTLTADANGITMTGLYKLDTLPTATAHGTNSKVLIQDGANSDEIRTITAQSIANLGTTAIADADADTKVQVEESADEDIIRFDVAGTEEMQMSASGIVINEGGNDRDIRIEGSSEANLLFTDGGNDRVGIGTNNPTTKLEVKGDTTISRSTDIGQTRTLIIEGARNATGTNYAQIDFKNYDSHGPTSYVGARIAAINEATGVNDGTLSFSTNNANAGITERMRIMDSGEVRILGEVEIDGALNHDGSNVGFYGVAPATRQPVGALSGNAINPTAGAAFVDPLAGGLFTADQGIYLVSVEQEITNLRTKLDALITALTTVGIIS